MNDMMIDAGEEDYVRLSALSKTVLRNNSEKKTEEWLSMRGPRPADLVDNSGKAITLNEDPVAVASNKFKQMEWSLGLENYTLGDKAARPMPKMVYAGDFSEKRTEGTAAIPTYAYRDELTHQIQVFRQDDMPSGVLSSAIDKGYSLSEFVRTGTVNLMNAAPSRVNLNGTYFDVTHVYDVKKGYTLQQVPVGPAPKSTGSTTWTPPKINARESTILNALNASAEDKFEKYTDKIADGLKSDAVWFERLGEVAKMSTKGVTFGLDTPKGQALLAAQIKWKDSMGGGVVPFIKPGTSKKEESFGEMLGNIFKPEENETYHYEGGEWSTIPADSYDMISVGNTDHLLWYKHSYKDEEHYWTDHQGKPKFEYFGIPPGTKLTQEQLNQHMQNRGLRYKE